MTDQSCALPAGTTIAHYRVEEKIGEGGMGEVYKAHDLTLERSVALKVLPPDLLNDVDRVRRFVQEAKSASALNHPNIVTIYEIGQTAVDVGGRETLIHYIAMEFIDGVTLRAKIYKGGSRAELIDALAQAADGLAKAHAAGIIHRDLKPDNIMVTRDGFAKVVDFGLAKLTESKGNSDVQKTQEGMIMGTIGYMSPEQVQGKTLDYKSDVFSFGCIIYEAIAKHRPFESDLAVDTLHRIIFSQPPLITDLAPDVPPDLQELIADTLKKTPAERTIATRDIAMRLRAVRPITESAERRIENFEKTAALKVVANVAAAEPAAPPAGAPAAAPLPASRPPYRTVPPPYRRKRSFAGVVSAFYKIAILALIATGAYVWFTLPDVASLENTPPPLVSAAGGKVPWAGYSDIASSVRRAAVIAEDKTFFDRSMVAMAQLKKPNAKLFSSGEYRFFPSPLTRATADAIYGGNPKNPLAAARNTAAAFVMEQKLSGNRIVELYLNSQKFGDTVGIAAASRKYFATTPDSLSSKQAALLAAAAQSGEILTPDKPSPTLAALQEELLAAMALSSPKETPKKSPKKSRKKTSQ